MKNQIVANMKVVHNILNNVVESVSAPVASRPLAMAA